MKKILCIDPSVQSLGWAVFELYEAYGVLINTGEIKIRKSNWIYRLDFMINQLYKLFILESIDLILIEQPIIYYSGRGAVAANSESIMKLCSFVFAVRQMFLDYFHAEVQLVDVRKWKGQIPKSVTQKRNKKHWNFESDNDDISDAVGIGDWYIRKRMSIGDNRSQLK